MKMIQMPSPNFGYRNEFGASGGRGIKGRHGHQVKAIVFHVFGGDFTPSTQAWFFRPGTEASYNDLILKNGDWLQIVDPFDPAWSNGVVSSPIWDGLQYSANRNVINPNLYTHSISREGQSHQITPAQEKTLYFVARFRADQHKLPIEKKSFIGHNQINSVRRAYCPGTGFDWKKFEAAMGIGAGFEEYTIVRGDSFWRISQRFKIPVPALIEANPHINDPALIFPGQVLRIPKK